LRGNRIVRSGCRQLVLAVGLEKPGLSVVREIEIQIADQAPLDLRISYRIHDLDSSKEIPVHPVGARAIDFLVSVVVKVVAA